MTLKPCPSCRKKVTAKPRRAQRRPLPPRGRVHRLAGWTTTYARTAGIAEKLWNDAKPANDKSP